MLKIKSIWRDWSVSSLIGLSILTAGCSSVPQQKSVADIQAQQPAVTKLPFVEPEPPAKELDEDILFHYLVGEVSAQRGELKLAYNHYLHAALLSGDDYAARRATQIAVFLKDLPGALKAADRWVNISPNSIPARNSAAMLHFRVGQQDMALTHLLALIDIAKARGKDGFLMTAISLAKEKEVADSALLLMQKLVSSFPKNENAHYANAVLLAAQKRYSLALMALQMSMELAPDKIKPKLLMSRILIDYKNTDEAIHYLETVLPAHEHNAELRLVYAKLLAAKDKQRAYQEFEKVYALNPQDMDVVSGLSVLSIQMEDLSSARQWLSILLNKGNREKRSEAAFQLGQLEEMGGDKVKAEEYYLKVKYGTYKSDARLRLARIQADLGKISSARDMLQQMRVLEPDNVVDYYLTEALILQQHGTQQQVFDFYRSALKAKPDDLALIYSRAIYEADEKMVDAAEKDFRRVLAKKPNHADALNALGYTLADQTDRYDEALSLISRAYSLKPKNAAILDSMGWVNFRLGNLTEALVFLQQALASHNDDEIAAHLGEVLWMSGKYGEARDVWSKALSDFPGSVKLTAVMKRLQ